MRLKLSQLIESQNSNFWECAVDRLRSGSRERSDNDQQVELGFRLSGLPLTITSNCSHRTSNIIALWRNCSIKAPLQTCLTRTVVKDGKDMYALVPISTPALAPNPNHTLRFSNPQCFRYIFVFYQIDYYIRHDSPSIP
jgi:hypothetical protein